MICTNPMANENMFHIIEIRNIHLVIVYFVLEKDMGSIIEIEM